MLVAGWKRGVASAVVAGAFLVVPSAGSAAVNFGSKLSTPAGNASCGPGACTIWNGVLPPANTEGTLTAPISGVVVSFTLGKVGPPWSAFHLRIVHLLTEPSWTGLAASSPNVTPTAMPGNESFLVRVPITVGDYLAIESDVAMPSYSLAGIPSASLRIASPPLPASGNAGIATPAPNNAIILQGRVEPDADNDGFGDETQDLCPTNATTQGKCPSKRKRCKRRRKAGAHTAGSALAAKKKKKHCRKRHRRK